jgi:hypothetical protein
MCRCCCYEDVDDRALSPLMYQARVRQATEFWRTFIISYGLTPALKQDLTV